MVFHASQVLVIRDRENSKVFFHFGLVVNSSPSLPFPPFPSASMRLLISIFSYIRFFFFPSRRIEGCLILPLDFVRMRVFCPPFFLPTLVQTRIGCQYPGWAFLRDLKDSKMTPFWGFQDQERDSFSPLFFPNERPFLQEKDFGGTFPSFFLPSSFPFACDSAPLG